MADKIPFDEDMMTLIMGVGGPQEPGQHGRTKAPFPTKDAISIITDIRDMCEEFLEKVGKDEEPEDEPRDEGKDGEDGFSRRFEEREEEGQEGQEGRKARR